LQARKRGLTPVSIRRRIDPRGGRLLIGPELGQIAMTRAERLCAQINARVIGARSGVCARLREKNVV